MEGSAAAVQTAMEPVVRLEDVHKRFGATIALTVAYAALTVADLALH